MDFNWPVARKVLQVKGDLSYREFERAIQAKTGKRIAYGTLRQIACKINRGDPNTIATIAEYADRPLSWFYEDAPPAAVSEARAQYLTPTGDPTADDLKRQVLEKTAQKIKTLGRDLTVQDIKYLTNVWEEYTKMKKKTE